MWRSMYVRLLQRVLSLLGRTGLHGSDSPVGEHGEDIAYWYLRRRGFTMVARNYQRVGVGGEVDLIAWDGGTLVFVEVKTRGSDEVRVAEDAVDGDKRRHLIAAARDYRRRARVEAPYRFDVVSVYPQPSGPARVEHFAGAFQEERD